MVRTGHVVAAFIGVLILAALRASDPASPVAQANPVMAVLWTALMFGAVWELISRLSKLLKRVQDRRPD